MARRRGPAMPRLPPPRPGWLCPLEASIRQSQSGLQSEGHPRWSGGRGEAGQCGNVGLGGPQLLPRVTVQAPSGQTGAMASSSGGVSRGMAGLGERVIHSPQAPGHPSLPLPAPWARSSGVSPAPASPVSPTALTPSPSAEAGGSKRPEQDPVPDPGLGARLPERAQVQGGPGHVPDHEGGR